MIDFILITSTTLIFALSGIAGEIDLLEMIRQTMWGPHGEIEGILASIACHPTQQSIGPYNADYGNRFHPALLRPSYSERGV